MTATPDQAELVIFAHLQRTGGNSLRELLAANYGSAATARGTADTIGTYVQRFEAGRLRAVEGLFKHGAHRFLSPGRAHRYFTFIRDPLARWSSYYHFCHVHPSAGLHALAKAHGFVDFLKHESRPRNAAAQVVFGYNVAPEEGGLQQAMERFAFIGVQERFAESAFVLSRVFGLRFPFVGVVGRLAGKTPEPVDPVAAAVLAAEDGLDRHLHAQADARLDRCLQALGAADQAALKIYRELVDTAAGSAPLGGVLDGVRAAAAPAHRSIALLRKRIASLPAEHRHWGEQVEHVVSHFEKAEPLPELWRSLTAAGKPRRSKPAADDMATLGDAAPGAAATSRVAVRLVGERVSLGDTRPQRLSVESMTSAPERAVFLEHHRRAKNGPSEVVAAAAGKLWLSPDLGKSWKPLALRGASGTPVRCFTTRRGRRLIQFQDDGRIHTFDHAGRLAHVANEPARAVHWHGAWSIDQSRSGAICWAEYVGRAERVAVYRSEDDGGTWTKSFEMDGREDAPDGIRHFHMALADPYVPGRWYLSSGDRGRECRIWVSDDDARTWVDIGAPRIVNASLFGLVGREHAILRTTAAVITPDGVYWSTDDLLGGRGPLYVRMSKNPPFDIEILGRVGVQHTRALLRAGTGNLVAISQGNAGVDHVAVHLLGTDGRMAELLRLPKPVDRLTSFCRAMSSTFIERGVFFTAGGGDVLDTKTRLWRWRLHGGADSMD